MGTVNDNKSRFLIGAEITLCFLAVAIPMIIRYCWTPGWDQAAPAEVGFKLFLYTAILWLALFLNDLYYVGVLTDKRRLLPRLAKAFLVAVVLYGLASALMPDRTQGRVVFFTALATVSLSFLIQYKYFRPLLERHLKKERVLVLGDSAIGDAIRRELREGDYQQTLIEDPEMVEAAINWVHRAGKGDTAIDPGDAGPDDRLNTIKNSVETIVLAFDNVPFPDRFDVSIPVHDGRAASNLVPLDAYKQGRSSGSGHSDSGPERFAGAPGRYDDIQGLLRGLVALKLRGVAVTGGLDYYERLTGRVYLGDPAGPLFFSHERYTIDKLSLAIKDVWERLLAFVIFVLAIPFLVLVPVAIFLDSGLPLLFVQQRVGRGGRIYKLYKWRSMTGGKVTRVGRIIRKTKLDELPQLVNVLRGQMSLVGPRPELPEYVRAFSGADCYYNLRHIVKPGLTGWAQIMFPDARAEHAMTKLSYDLFYVKHFSLVSDMVIMVETFKMIVFGNRHESARRHVPEPGSHPPSPSPTEPGGPDISMIRLRTGGS